jgi:translation initiation factor 2 beta subunit (eIF-2beta)/eIF-5
MIRPRGIFTRETRNMLDAEKDHIMERLKAEVLTRGLLEEALVLCEEMTDKEALEFLKSFMKAMACVRTQGSARG